MQISRPRRFEAAGRRAFGSGTRCPQRVYLFRPPCAPNFRYVRCASPITKVGVYATRGIAVSLRRHEAARIFVTPPANQYICVSDVDMVATKMPAPNEVHFRPCRQASEQACAMQPVRGSWLDAVLESPGRHCQCCIAHMRHVASRMQCELIRIHIAWAFVESNNHCDLDLNQKALMVAFRLVAISVKL